MAAQFHFVCTDSHSNNVLTDPSVADLLRKWSMKNYLRIQRYSFNEPFQVHQKQEFVEDFFKDANVTSTLIGFATGSPCPIGEQIDNISGLQFSSLNAAPSSMQTIGIAPSSVSVRRVPCTLTSIALFRRLSEVGVIRAGDIITPCAETQVGDIIINDRLRSVLLCEDDEDWDVYNAGERSEFLFRLVRLLVVGGRWCQYEDTIKPYLDTACKIYKSLVCVERDPSDGQLTVCSAVFEVNAQNSCGEFILPLDPHHPQEVFFLCVDLKKRTVIVLSHHYGHQFYE